MPILPKKIDTHSRISHTIANIEGHGMDLTELVPEKRLKRIKSADFKRVLLDDYESLEPERRMWRCVLIEIAIDAVDYVAGGVMSPRSTVDDLKDAFTMVFEHTLDFDLNASWSGVDPDIAREAILDEVIGLKNFAKVLDSYRNDVARFTTKSRPFKPLDKINQIHIEFVAEE